MPVKFVDNSIKVKDVIDDKIIEYLYEASGELVEQTARNTYVAEGQLRDSWGYNVNEDKKESKIGSPLENAIWEEFGTGEHALKGNGRKTPWVYQDKNGKWHTTRGKKPRRVFWNAYKSSKPSLISRAEEIFRGIK